MITLKWFLMIIFFVVKASSDLVIAQMGYGLAVTHEVLELLVGALNQITEGQNREYWYLPFINYSSI